MTDAWIELARGPLFRLSLAVCLLGLGTILFTTVVSIVRAWRSAGDKTLPIGAIARSTLRWVAPVHLAKVRPLYSAASIAFHAGILLVPVFSLGHVGLWQPATGIPWPVLPPAAADTLSLASAVALLGLLVSRVSTRVMRGLSRAQDSLVLALLLGVVVSGLGAAHPTWAPVDSRTLLLVHLLLADTTLVLTPMTKIAHCILFPVLQLVFELGWHFPAASGRHVATALAKEDERV